MRTYLTLLLVMAFWGSAFASSKLAVDEIPHEAAGFLRFIIGSAILLALHATLGRGRLPRNELPLVAGLGLFGVFGYNALFFLALSLAPSADGGVIVPISAPVITVAVSAALGRRRLTPRAIAGLAAAAGGGVIFFAGIPPDGSHRLIGDLLFVAAASCWAAYTICGAPLLGRRPAFTVTTYATIVGALALGVLAVPTLDDVPWYDLDSAFWLNMIYLAALPTALAYVLYYQAVRLVGPAVAASAMFLVPVFGLACSWLLVGESITPVQALGSVLMLAGAWLAIRPQKRASV